jgi:adenosylcobyric acid synthase
MSTKAIFVGGTASHAGKSWMATAICAWLRERGFRVAPFKAQNMSNNSYPCKGGGEIGRAQVAQARACGLEPEPLMNPILLKPNSATGSQVVVHGKVWRTLPARGYYEHFDWLLGQVLDAYDQLARRFDVIVIEGAGSVAELNLRRFDLVNFGLATRVGANALLVSDIERGGVFGSIIGTVSLLEPEERALLRAFAVNKFRGDLSLFDEGRNILEVRTGVPCLGVFPFAQDIHLDDEDSLSVPAVSNNVPSGAEVAILRFPRVSNSTDFRLLPDACWLDRPVDHPFRVIFLPGSKNTIDDLHWLRTRGFEEWLRQQWQQGATLVGICGGLQMLGQCIRDPLGAESLHGEAKGLGYLPLETELTAEKTVREVQARTPEGKPFAAYEIHLGESRWLGEPDSGFALVEGSGPGEPAGREGGHWEGARLGRVLGTYLHGAMESRDVLWELLGLKAEAMPEGNAQMQALAGWFEQHQEGFAELFL